MATNNGFALKFENKDGYSVAFTDSSVRVGLSGVNCVSFPPSHSLYQVAADLTPENVEEFFDNEVAPRILA